MTDTNLPEKTPNADMGVKIFVAKGDDSLASNRRELEDEYSTYYENNAEFSLIAPPYDPRRLEELVERNNTLGPCIDAMVTNIDGTGYEIQRRDGEKMKPEDDKIVQKAYDFFDECAPMMSFQTLRSTARREAESTGMGYMEVIRNVVDEVVMVGPLEAKMMRFGRLDTPVAVETTMLRFGKEETFTRMVRERRFAQKFNDKLVWFKEFGASRDLNKFTGQWAAQGERLPANDRATEVLSFGINPDITTPYFVPRWISQVPSVIGSRQAEEHNLEFFSSGGIPPYLIIVQGGQLAEKTVEAVREALNQKGAHARVQVIEAYSTAGSLESAGGVQVKVERFGAEKSNDAMFAAFDKDCEQRIRKSFRLPPIMVGKSEDYNFASAQASYLVAEAQVFKPARDAFDEIISTTLLPAILDSRDYAFRSKPISIIDATTQLSIIQAGLATGHIDREHVVTLLGEIGNMEFQLSDIEDVAKKNGFQFDPAGNVVPFKAPINPNDPNAVAAQAQQLQEGVQPQVSAKGKVGAPKPIGKSELDPLSHLLGCALSVMDAQQLFEEVEG